MSTRHSCTATKGQAPLVVSHWGFLLSGAVLVVLLNLTGCFRQDPSQQLPDEAGHYELAWVEPKILLSDSLFTLIRAERLDSFFVAEAGFGDNRIATSLVFETVGPDCFVRIGLLEPGGALVHSFVAQKLPKGVYKFKFDQLRYAAPLLNAPYYYLTTEYCGQTQRNKIHGH